MPVSWLFVFIPFVVLFALIGIGVWIGRKHLGELAEAMALKKDCEKRGIDPWIDLFNFWSSDDWRSAARLCAIEKGTDARAKWQTLDERAKAALMNLRACPYDSKLTALYNGMVIFERTLDAEG